MTTDPNAYLANFSEICNTIKFNGVSDDAVKFRLFPFSLRDKVKVWLNSYAPTLSLLEVICLEPFLNKYFPPKKLLSYAWK